MNRLANFSDFALTRAEMKNVQGGAIICGCYLEGVYHYEGRCSGSTLEECASYQCSGGGKNSGCRFE
jgi:hypothetical protein